MEIGGIILRESVDRGDRVDRNRSRMNLATMWIGAGSGVRRDAAREYASGR